MLTGLLLVKCYNCEKAVGFLTQRDGDPLKIPEESEKVTNFLLDNNLFMFCPSCAARTAHQAHVNLTKGTFQIDDDGLGK